MKNSHIWWWKHIKKCESFKCSMKNHRKKRAYTVQAFGMNQFRRIAPASSRFFKRFVCACGAFRSWKTVRNILFKLHQDISCFPIERKEETFFASLLPFMNTYDKFVFSIINCASNKFVCMKNIYAQIRIRNWLSKQKKVWKHFPNIPQLQTLTKPPWI